MKIDLNTIADSKIPGLTGGIALHLYEACVVCLTRQNHNYLGTPFQISGDETLMEDIIWNNIYDDQLDRAWKDQGYATEHGAVCLAILIALKLTNFTIIERSAKTTGFDYWLGDKDDLLFQKKGRLEISGIFNGTDNDIKKRYQVKIKQTGQSDSMQIPAYIGIVEFSKPIIKFGAK